MELTKKGIPFNWNSECEDTFQVLKREFIRAPVLVMPNPDEPFYLETDASNYASDTVLMQKDDNGHLHPCGYLSKTFSEMEQKYPIGD
jgi:hypothetical protein